MSVDEIRSAMERTVPSYAGRTGDWEGVVARSRLAGVPVRRRWWRLGAVALAGLLTLVFFWPRDDSNRILERARAAVQGGPVVHVVLRSGSLEFYDLRLHRLRRVPVEREVWFDENRGLHQVERVYGRVLDDVLYTAIGPEVAMQFRGLADVYRRALTGGDADVGASEKFGDRHVYWITFRVRYPETGIAAYDEEHEVAVDATSYEPVAWRVGGTEYRIVSWATLPRGQGDFDAGRSEGGDGAPALYGATRVGIRAPADAREVLPNAVWLGKRFEDAPVDSIREMRYETGPWVDDRPARSVPGLELCYGSGQPCSVTVAETTEPHPMSGRGHSWQVVPPPATLAFDERANIGYLVRAGVYVTVQARSRKELIAAAEKLTPIP